mmetsp:Transcript_8122/g.17724  ORF Transcript_8122/g.17724 Transcript_8122/m.17724 type:complete len:223 (-) Transcript_8122:1065-1733(-)
MAEQNASSRHRGYWRRFSHQISVGYFVPRWIWLGRLRCRHWCHASGHARECVGPLQRQDAARNYSPRLGARHSLLRHPGGPAHCREEEQEEHLLRPHPRDRGPGDPEVRAGLRARGRLRREVRGRLLHQAGQGAHRRVPDLEHHDAQVDDRGGLRRRPHDQAPHRLHGGVARQPGADGGGQGRDVQEGVRDRPRHHHRAGPLLPQRPGRRQDPLGDRRGEDR